jgi:hypothetical protein
MKFRIFKPAKNAMQSGKKNTQKWLMLPIEENIRFVNPVTGWISAADTSSQLRYEFSSAKDAVTFAQKNGFEYIVEEPKAPTVKQKSYASNFTS